MVVRLDRTWSLGEFLLSLLARLGCTERSARLARTTITSTSRSVNDVEVRPISNLLVDLPRGTTASDDYRVSCSCDLLLWLWIGQLQVPCYRFKQAPKTASLSLIVHVPSAGVYWQLSQNVQWHGPNTMSYAPIYFLLYGCTWTNKQTKKKKLAPPAEISCTYIIWLQLVVLHELNL